jgi:acetylornithine deacetylase/succinyl-diaminopimelate desuccinylase-like protein
MKEWIERSFPKIREELFAFYRFKTISADPSMRPELDRCAEWLRKKFESLGCSAELISTFGPPLVYAEDLSAGPNAPTLLIYGHYDVQPVDPIELWNSDPFEPVEKDGIVTARGAQDDKGQIFYAITALAALRASGSLKVNLKYCIEGEEEFGSDAFSKALPSLKKKLRADYLLVVDFGIPNAHTGSINLGARGISTLEIILRGSKGDLHSGTFGGIAYNPNRALAELIAKCWDETGRIRIPGFYDGVTSVSPKEEKLFSDEFEGASYRDEGIEALAFEKGYTLLQSNWFRPTLEINGMAGGYAGPGFKTVIPAEARAKISARLVPNQDPEKIAHLIGDFFRKNAPKGMQVRMEFHHGGKPYRASADSKLAVAVSKAYEELFQKPCLKTLSGASIPIISDLMHTCGASVVGMGFGLASDGIHAPNEHFGLDRFKKGIWTVARSIELLGSI